MKFLEQEKKSSLIDYFKTYRISDIVSDLKYVYDIRWIGCRLKFERITSSGGGGNQIFSIANLYADNSQKSHISVQTAIGYDPSKRYNFKVKLTQKLVSRYDSRISGFLTFDFLGINDVGSLINKSSQKISVDDITEGDEIIIPIEPGEYLNNLLIIYDIPDTSANPFTLLFEFYFEEIAE
jgi:hypothetical protein